MSKQNVLQKFWIAPSRPIYRRWVYFTVLGLLAGQLTITAVMEILISNELVGIGWFMGHGYFLLLYLFVGVMQWMILRRHFNAAHWWIVAVALGNYLGAVIGLPMMDFVLKKLADPTVPNLALVLDAQVTRMLLEQLTVSSIAGTLQWLYWRRRLVNTSIWILAVVVSGLLVLLLRYIPRPQLALDGVLFDISAPFLYFMVDTFVTVLAGVVLSGITGVVLLDFLDRKGSAGLFTPEAF